MVLRKIGPWSCARILAVMYALLGLVEGIFFAVFTTVVSTVSRAAHAPGAPVFPFFFGAAGIIFFPVMLGLLGLVGGGVGAWVYNLLADAIGGIELTLGEEAGAAPAPAPAPPAGVPA